MAPGPVTVGLDLGGTKCLGVVVDAEGRVTAEHRLPTPRGERAIVDVLAAVAEALLPGLPAGTRVGVGAPGLVERSGVLRFAPNLPGVVDLDVRAELEARLGVGVRVDNDASCAGWAEARVGAARGPTTPCSSPSAPGSAAASSSTVASRRAPTASPARSATW